MSTQYYALKRHHWKTGTPYFAHIYTSEIQVKMCIDVKDPEQIYEVEVIEQPGGSYYGWLRTGEEYFSIIYPTDVQFRVCFPYGVEAEEQAGHGRAVRLAIWEKGAVEG